MYYPLQNCIPNLTSKLRLEESMAWNNFIESTDCENSFPSHVQNLSAFQKLLLVQALRPDRLRTMMIIFAQKSLGLNN